MTRPRIQWQTNPFCNTAHHVLLWSHADTPGTHLLPQFSSHLSCSAIVLRPDCPTLDRICERSSLKSLLWEANVTGFIAKRLHVALVCETSGAWGDWRYRRSSPSIENVRGEGCEATKEKSEIQESHNEMNMRGYRGNPVGLGECPGGIKGERSSRWSCI